MTITRNSNPKALTGKKPKKMAKGGMVKGFSPIVRVKQRFTGVH